MINVSEVKKEKPNIMTSKLQEEVYNTLDKLNVSFERVDCDEAFTMEDCENIDKKLNMKTVKTLFLCNRQQTEYYLFVTKGDKKFDCKKFGQELGIARVSFASAEKTKEMLDMIIGAVTVFGALLDKDNRVKVVFDRDVLKSKTFGCTDGTLTCYMKIKTSDIIEKVLPYSGHEIITINM